MGYDELDIETNIETYELLQSISQKLSFNKNDAQDYASQVYVRFLEEKKWRDFNPELGNYRAFLTHYYRQQMAHLVLMNTHNVSKSTVYRYKAKKDNYDKMTQTERMMFVNKDGKANIDNIKDIKVDEDDLETNFLELSEKVDKISNLLKFCQEDIDIIKQSVLLHKGDLHKTSLILKGNKNSYERIRRKVRALDENEKITIKEIIFG